MRENLIKFVKQWEGCRLERYDDIGGKGTIGVGHLIKPGENYTTITQQQADDLLWQDLQKAIAAVRRLITCQLTEGQQIALIDFCFNLGAHSLQSSTLRMKLNRGDFTDITAEFLKYDHVRGTVIPGLKHRRLAESIIFLGNNSYSLK